MRIVLDHVTLSVRDLPASQTFYDAALSALGVARLVEYTDPEDEAGVEAIGYGVADEPVQLWLVAESEPTSGVHLGFRAEDASAVDAFFAAATGVGARPRQAPRAWPIYRPGAYTAMVLDPDGNVVEALVLSEDRLTRPEISRRPHSARPAAARRKRDRSPPATG